LKEFSNKPITETLSCRENILNKVEYKNLVDIQSVIKCAGQNTFNTVYLADVRVADP
jgi:hypothetical protein